MDQRIAWFEGMLNVLCGSSSSVQQVRQEKWEGSNELSSGGTNRRGVLRGVCVTAGHKEEGGRNGQDCKVCCPWPSRQMPPI